MAYPRDVDRDRLERMLDPAAVGDVTALPMDELRKRRAEGQELEVAISYQRRIAQGRLDIVAAEQRLKRQRPQQSPPDAARAAVVISRACVR